METTRLKKKKMSRSQFIVQFLSQRVVSGRKKIVDLWKFILSLLTTYYVKNHDKNYILSCDLSIVP